MVVEDGWVFTIRGCVGDEGRIKGLVLEETSADSELAVASLGQFYRWTGRRVMACFGAIRIEQKSRILEIDDISATAC